MIWGKEHPIAVPKSVIFITDNYGFRNTQQGDKEYDIVIIGDSMTVGSSLTQTDTLSEILARRTNQTIYNYAPASPTQFLADSRFQTSPPHTVIFQVVERNLLTNFCLQTLNATIPTPIPNTLIQSLKIFLDNAVRNPSYLQAYITGNFTPNDMLLANSEGMVFFDQSISAPDHSSASIEQLIESLKRCEEWFSDRGINFIFLPVPDKENVFFDQIPAEARPPISDSERSELFANIIAAARTNEIDTVDLLTAYLQARETGMIPYQLDDTHWNPTGVAIAVEQILPLLDAQ